MKTFYDFVATLDDDFYEKSIHAAFESNKNVENEHERIISISYAMAMNLLAKYHSWLSEQNDLS